MVPPIPLEVRQGPVLMGGPNPPPLGPPPPLPPPPLLPPLGGWLVMVLPLTPPLEGLGAAACWAAATRAASAATRAASISAAMRAVSSTWNTAKSATSTVTLVLSVLVEALLFAVRARIFVALSRSVQLGGDRDLHECTALSAHARDELSTTCTAGNSLDSDYRSRARAIKAGIERQGSVPLVIDSRTITDKAEEGCWRSTSSKVNRVYR